MHPLQERTIFMVRSSARFLHIADIHLGFDHYDSPARSQDFFLAFRDVLQRYAVDLAVDFVLIAGDLFEYKSILPSVLNQAESGLTLLKKAGIPVLAIEGNHDNRPYGVKTSWLRYLADHDYLVLLEPTETENGMVLEPWSSERREGGYLDLPCGVRVIGSQWYGSATPRAIQDLVQAIQRLPSDPGFTILLFHQGLEGQVARYTGAIRYTEILPLKQAGVDYLAMGHIHKTYTEEGWIFNPGSLEANSMAEYEYERGAYLVDIQGKTITASLQKNYYQRICYRLRWEARGRETVEEVQNGIRALIQKKGIDPEDEPVVELKIVGKLGFPRHDLDQRLLQKEIQAMTGALFVLVRVEAIPLEFDQGIMPPNPEERLAIEEQVYLDLLSSHAHYRRRGFELMTVLKGLKEMILEGKEDRDVYETLSQAYLGHALVEED
jgi:DNA repair exonuclease SbcCD nuclease subunit